MPLATADYQITALRRRGRSLSLRVSPDGTIKVGVPYGTSQRVIERFIRSKQDWIEKQVRKSADIYNFAAHPKISEDLLVKLQLGTQTVAEFLPPKTVLVTYTPSQSSDYWQLYQTARPHIKRQLNKLAQTQLTKELSDISNSVDLAPSKTVVRFMRSRWGSCTSRGKITVNSQLLRLPLSLRNYVMYHELCHLKVPNHSAKFYNQLERLLPNAKTYQRQLKTYKLFA